MKRIIECDKPCLKMHSLLLPIIEMAQQRGVDSHRILRGSKLFYEDLTQPEKQISFVQLEQVFANTHECLSHDGISFLLAQHWLFNQPQAAFQALLNCQNLGDMSRVLQVRQAHIWPYMFFENYASSSGYHIVINPAIAQPSPYALQFMIELIVAILDQLCRWRFDLVKHLCVKLPYAQPTHIEQYHAHLKLNYQFAQPCFSITIPKGFWLRKQTLPSNSMRGFYLAQSKASVFDIGFIQYICSQLKACPKQSATELSARMGISVATLKRKLKLHNTSLQMLKDQGQKQQAVVNILERGCSNEQVAQQLDYADMTNFRRNFKRWTGLTPSELRKLFS